MKECLVFHVSILGTDQKYEMEKRATGMNLILIFNWSGLRDPEMALYAAVRVTMATMAALEQHTVLIKDLFHSGLTHNEMSCTLQQMVSNAQK